MGRTGLYVARVSRAGIPRGGKKGKEKKPAIVSKPVSSANHEGHKIGVYDGNTRCLTCKKVISYHKRPALKPFWLRRSGTGVG